MKNFTSALLPEDEVLVALDLEQALEEVGLRVTSVMTNVDALAALDAGRPDVAVVDILLRDGRSDAVVERLIAERIPFIVHSGDHPNMHAGTPFAEGVWVNKPARMGELEEVALALLDTRPMLSWLEAGDRATG